ncbi:MAG: hypothetical protein IPO81_31470 [Kouleothrix sp.]|nr:hypothetical protein [Kouleothrix sp.]
MSEQGYSYRRRGQSAAELRALIERYVPAGAIFGGDLVALADDIRSFGPGDMRPLDALDDWDFGHAFCAEAELRWRRAADGFDVLLLTEQERAEFAPGEQVGQPWALRRPSEDLRIMLDRPKGARLSFVQYLAPNQAVQFVRYREVGP